jgi:hypothetical protein
MTVDERTQLEKDILYEHHKADTALQAELVRLRRDASRLTNCAEKVNRFISYIENVFPLRAEGAPSGLVTHVDVEEINRSVQETLRLREKVDQLAKDKKSLGL